MPNEPVLCHPARCFRFSASSNGFMRWVTCPPCSLRLSFNVLLMESAKRLTAWYSIMIAKKPSSRCETWSRPFSTALLWCCGPTWGRCISLAFDCSRPHLNKRRRWEHSWAGSIWRVRVYPKTRLHENDPDRPALLQVIGGETPDLKNTDLMMTYNNPLVRARKPKKKKPSRTKARQRKGLG